MKIRQRVCCTAERSNEVEVRQAGIQANLYLFATGVPKIPVTWYLSPGP